MIHTRIPRKVRDLRAGRSVPATARLLFRAAGSALPLLALALLTRTAHAQVSGEQVAAGQASFSRGGSTTTITASNGAIINYQQFNIPAGHTVQFIQPSATSRVLNRITGPDPTTISGNLFANGIVYITNAAGVYFRSGALVDVGGIYAAAGHISDADFVNGMNRFTGLSGSVVNQGTINARTAALVGSVVLNEGVVQSPQGYITLAAGDEVMLGERGSNIYVRMNPPTADTATTPSAGDPARVTNTGTLNARGGRVSMVVGDMYGVALRNTGTVRGREVRLHAEGRGAAMVSGTIDATTAAGGQRAADGDGARDRGSVQITGGYVSVEGATIDASGVGGGGTVNIGGGFQGRGLPSATNTVVDSGSSIRADAIGSGNGGTVVVWSDGVTVFRGSASATGGETGGDGGLIETSGRLGLDVRGSYVSAAAGLSTSGAAGRAGTWLLDPSDITITTSTSGGSYSGTLIDVFNPTGTGAVSSDVDVASITSRLQSGTNVVIQTYNPDGTSPGNILVTTAINVNVANGAVTLTLRAAGNIEFQAGAGVTATNGPLSLTLQAANLSDANAVPGSPNPEPPPPVPGAGDVIVGANINLNGGTFTSSGNGFSNTGGFTITTTAAGGININHAAAVDIGGALTGGSIAVTGASINLGAAITANAPAGSVQFTGPVTLAADSSVSSGSGGINFLSTIDGAFDLTLTAGTGNIDLASNVGGGTRIGDLLIVSAADVSTLGVRAATVTQQAGSGTTSFMGEVNTNAAGGVDLTGNIFAILGGLVTTNGGAVTVANAGLLDLSINAATLDGAFTQTGAGAVSLGAGITTTNDLISFASAVTLTSDTALTSAGGNIDFNGTVDGGFDLTLTAGGGTIAFDQAVGGAARLGDVLFVSSGGVTGGALRASTITQQANSGATTFTGELNTDAAGGVDLTGGAISLTGGVVTTNGGPVTIANGGLLTLSTTALNLDGAFTQTGAGAVSLGTNITTSGDLVSFASAVTLTADSAIASAGGNIDFNSTIDGGFDLSLTAGAGSIFLDQAVGGSTRLADFTITSAADVTAAGIRAATITQSAGTGATSFTGELNTNAAGGISLTGSAFTITGGIITTNGGPLAIANAGLLSLSTTALSLDGAFTQTGAGLVNLGTNITTTSDLISFASAVTLTADSALTSAGGNITFNGTVNGGFDLSLTAGAGSIAFNQAVGGSTRLADLLIVSAAGVTGGGVRAATITQQAGTGTTAFTGLLDTTGAGGVSLTGGIISLTGGVTATGGGGVTVSNAGLFTLTGTLGLDGAFAQTGAGGVNLGAAITTTNDTIAFASPVTLTAGTTLNTGATGADVTFSDSIDGAFALSITAGGGTITFADSLGAAARLASLLIGSAANVNGTSVRAGSITQSAGTGATAFTGQLNTDGAAGIALTGNAFSLTGGIVTTNGGGLSITNAGALTLSGGLDIDGGLTQGGAGGVTLGGLVETHGGGATFNGAVTIDAGGATIGTASATDGPPADIVFNAAVEGPGDLTLDAGTASILFNSTVGAATRMGLVTFVNALNIAGSSLRAASVLQQAGTGTTSFTGEVNTNAAGGIDLTGNAFTFTGGIVTTNGGPVAIANAGLLTLSTTALNLDGAFTQTGAGLVSLGANITTTGDLISFASGVTLTADTALTSAGGGITFNGTLNGGFDLTLTAGAGNIDFGDNVGGGTRLGDLLIVSAGDVSSLGIRAATVTQQAGTGATSFLGEVNTNAAGGISLTTNAVSIFAGVVTTNGGPLAIANSGLLTISTTTLNLDGAFTQTGAGLVNLGTNITTTGDLISFASDVTLTADSALTSAGGNITFNGTVNGGFDLSLTAGAGSVAFNQAVGGSTRLADLLIVSAAGVTGGGVRAATFTQQAGSGTTSLSGELNTNAAGGISLTGSAFTLTGGVVTTGGGTVAIANGGLLTLSTAALNLDGAFTQTGAGAVSLGTGITTTGDLISFASAVALTADAILTSAGGNIFFGSTVNGSGQDLSLSAGTGGVTFSAALGNLGRMGDIAVTSSGSGGVSGTSVTAATLDVTSTGPVSFTGLIDLNAAPGLTIAATTIGLTGGMNLTGGAGLSLTNSGLLTLSGAPIVLSGPFAQNGPGAVSLGTSITTSGQSISFGGPVTLIADSALNSAGGDITFNGAVNGAFDLTLTAGAGSIAFNQAVGASTRLADLLIVSALNVSGSSVRTASITQQAGSGTTSFSGQLNTNTAAGISLVGNAFTLSGGGVTTNGGGLSVANAGALSLIGGFDIDGAISQSGAGAVSVADLIQTHGEAITFDGVVTIAAAGATISNTAAMDGPPDIVFNAAVEGPGNLTLDAGAGSIIFNSTVGAATRMGIVTFVNALNIAGSSLRAASVVQQAGSGLTSFTGEVNTNAAGGIDLTGNAFTFTGGIVTSSLGSVTIDNAGLLSLSTVALNLDSAFLQVGAGLVSLGADITTNANTVFFASAVTLTADVAVTTNSGPIDFNSTLNGGFDLTLDAGAAFVSFAGAVGGVTRLGDLDITAGGVTGGSVRAATITSVATTGGTFFTGALDTNAVGGIDLTGSIITLSGGVTTTNGGVVTIANDDLLTISSAALNLDGAFTQTGPGAVSLGTGITTTGDLISFASALTLTSDVTLTSAGGAVTFQSTVDGSGRDLSIGAGAGLVTFSAALGGGGRMGDIAVTSSGGVSGASVTAATLDITSTGAVSFAGLIDLNASPGLAIAGTTIDLTGGMNLTGGAGLSLTNSGLLTLSGAPIVLSGPFIQNGPGAVSLGTSITTSGQSISFGGPVTLIADSALTSAGSAITFNGTVDGGFDLTLTAGAGSIAFNQAVGASTRLADLLIVSAAGVTGSSARAASITQQAGSGTTSFSGQLNTNSAVGIDLTGNAFSLTGGIVTTNGGGLAIANSGALTLSGGVDVDGVISQTGAGAVTLGGLIETHGGGVSFAAPVTIGSATTIATTAVLDGPPVDIVFNAAVEGPGDLTLDAGAASIFFNSTVGAATRMGIVTFVNALNITGSSLRAASVVQQAGTGLTAFSGAVNTNAAGGIDLTGNAFTFTGGIVTTGGGPLAIANAGQLTLSTAALSLDGAFTQTGAGAVDLGSNITTTGDSISFVSAVALTADTALSTGGGPGDITFGSTLDGGFDLALSAPGGAIQFGGAVGGLTPLDAVSISSSASISGSSLSAASLLASSTGSIAFTGLVTASGAAGIDLTGDAISLTGGSLTGSGGGLTIVNTGLLTLAGVFDLAGAFDQSGGGPVSAQGIIQTSGDNVTFDDALTLANNLTITTAGGDVDFGSTVDGAFTLALTAGAGDIRFAAAVGGLTPLDALVIQSAADVTAAAISANTIVQLAGTGTTSLSGLLSAGAGGIVLTSSNVSITGGAATTSGGDFILAAATQGTITGPALSIDGQFAAITAAPLTLASNITAEDGMTFLGPVTLTGPVALSTGSGTGDIVFQHTLNGASALSLTADGGSITFVQDVGVSARLGAVTVVSANDVTALGAFRANGFAQLAGAGTTFFSGAANFLSGGLSFTGNNLTLFGGVTTSSTGGVSVVNAGTLSIIGAPLALDGTFTQTGAGPVNLGTNISTTNDFILFLRAITLTGNSTISNGFASLTFGSFIDGPHVFTLNGTGPTLFAAPVGSVTPLTSLINNRTGLINIATSQSVTNILRHAGPVVVNANATFTSSDPTGQVFFGSTLNGPVDVIINGPSAGPVTFTGAVGGGNPLNSLTVSSGTITAGSTVTTAGAQSYTGDLSLGGDLTTTNGAVTVTGATTLTADVEIETGSGAITFTGPGTIDGAFDLILDSTAAVTLDGSIGAATPLSSFRTIGNSVTSFAGTLATTGGITFGNNLVLTGDSILNAGNGPAWFFGSINSDGTPRALSILTTAAAINGLPSAQDLRDYLIPIAFAGNIGDLSPLASLGLNYAASPSFDGRGSIPTVATIVFTNALEADGSITAANVVPATNFVINVLGDFVMGQNEKMLVLGNLSISAATARLSDISTLGNMAVTAPVIQLRNRATGQVAGFSTSNVPTLANDQGLDFVAGGNIAFSTAPVTVSGPAFAPFVGNPRPNFSNPDGTGDVNGTLVAYPFRAFGSDPIFDQFLDRPAPNNTRALPFDLRAEGPTLQNVSESIAAFVVVDVPRVPEETAVGLAQRQQLEEIAIFVRDLAVDELIEALIGRALYNDKPLTVRTDNIQRRVSAGRLSFDSVREILTEYQALIARSAETAAAIAQAVEAWFSENPDKDFDPKAFAAFLLARNEDDPGRAAAMALSSLFIKVEELGLSRVEQRGTKQAIVKQILPADVSAAQLAESIDIINQTLYPRRYPAPAAPVAPADPTPGESPDPANPEAPAAPSTPAPAVSMSR